MSRCSNITDFEKSIYKEMDRLKIDGHDLYRRLDKHPGSDKVPLVKGDFLFLVANNPHDPTMRSLVASYRGSPYYFLCRYAVDK